MFRDFDPRQSQVFFERRRMESHAIAIGLFGGLLTCAFMGRPEPEAFDVELTAELEDLAVEDESESQDSEPEAETEAPKPKPKRRIRAPIKKVTAPPKESTVDKAAPEDMGEDADGPDVAEKTQVTEEAPKVAEAKPKKKRPKKKIDPTQPVDRPEKATSPEPDPGNKAPAYPEDLRTKGVTGMVVIKLHVHRDGRVKGAKILKATTTATGEDEKKQAEKAFKKAVIAAVRHWKYTPSMLDNEPISVWIIVNFPFRLSS
jgi:TonB family protein